MLTFFKLRSLAHAAQVEGISACNAESSTGNDATGELALFYSNRSRHVHPHEKYLIRKHKYICRAGRSTNLTTIEHVRSFAAASVMNW